MDKLNNLLFDNLDVLSDDQIIDTIMCTDFEIPDCSDLDSDEDSEDLGSDGILQFQSVSCTKLRQNLDTNEKPKLDSDPSSSTKLDSLGLGLASPETQSVSSLQNVDPTISTNPKSTSSTNRTKSINSSLSLNLQLAKGRPTPVLQDLTNKTSPSHSQPSSSSCHLKPTSTSRPKIKPLPLKPLWMVKNLEYRKNITFTGSSTLPENILGLQTPYQFFRYFFDDELIQSICEETIRYSVMKDPSKPYDLSPPNLQKYLGILVMMSVVKLNNIRSYWCPNIGNRLIAETMSINTFEDIRRFLHFNDISKMKPRDDPGHDRLFRLRPVIDHLQHKFKSVPLEPELSIDEQVCATKIRHFMKQYNPMKPHKWGFKLFVLSGVSGFAYNFEIFSGVDPEMLPEEPNLGACANVVIRLSRMIPNDQHYQLYFDNWYTTLPLLVFLEKKQIHSLGTLRKNRFPGLKFPEEKVVKKQPRGTTYENVALVDGVDVSVVQWLDNKIVTIASTFVGSNPVGMCKRYDRKNRCKVDVPRPKVIEEYVKFMGGVDLLDSLLGQHKISMKSRKWYFRIFYHLVDLTIVNAWLLYRRVHGNNMPQTKFREELAITLCLIGEKSTPKRGRPSNTAIENQLQEKKRKGPALKPPPHDVRLDNTGHWPAWSEHRLRCKLPQCKGYSFVICEKCGFSLCFNKDRNCFRLFHAS